MKRTFISAKLLIYYTILLILMILCIIYFSINPIFFSIMIGLIIILWVFNRSTIIEVGKEIKIIDFYLFLPVIRKRINRKDLESIKVTKMISDDGFGISDNVFLDIIIVYIFGFYWSQPQSIINYKVKGKPTDEKIKLNLTASSVKKVLN